jgi:hypothetical protein
MLYALCYSLGNGWNHPEIAIKLNFWYSEVKFRRVIETDVKEFKIGVENELRKDQLFGEVIERVKENSIKKGKKEYFITIA